MKRKPHHRLMPLQVSRHLAAWAAVGLVVAGTGAAAATTDGFTTIASSASHLSSQATAHTDTGSAQSASAQLSTQSAAAQPTSQQASAAPAPSAGIGQAGVGAAGIGSGEDGYQRHACHRAGPQPVASHRWRQDAGEGDSRAQPAAALRRHEREHRVHLRRTHGHGVGTAGHVPAVRHHGTDDDGTGHDRCGAGQAVRRRRHRPPVPRSRSTRQRRSDRCRSVPPHQSGQRYQPSFRHPPLRRYRRSESRHRQRIVPPVRTSAVPVKPSAWHIQWRRRHGDQSRLRHRKRTRRPAGHRGRAATGQPAIHGSADSR